MFEKTTDEATGAPPVKPVPASPTKIVSTELPDYSTVIGSDVIFKGEMMAGESVIINGAIEGKISRHTKNVFVGEQGRVTAMIHASTVTIRGQVDGDIYGDELVELLDGARVTGNIYCSCVRVQKGAQFNGTVSMAST